MQSENLLTLTEFIVWKANNFIAIRHFTIRTYFLKDWSKINLTFKILIMLIAYLLIWRQNDIISRVGELCVEIFVASDTGRLKDKTPVEVWASEKVVLRRSFAFKVKYLHIFNEKCLKWRKLFV